MAKKGKPPKPATETGTPRAVSPRGASAPGRPGKPPSARLPSARPSALLDTRVVYCGDNLEQLAKLPDACVDLIYIDPPFNSNRNYEVFWGETKEKRSFEDRHASTAAYIDYMRPRCVQLARVMRKTGSFYYHCDWHASHYVKTDILDRIFGENLFQAEIVWKRTTAHGDTRGYGHVTDSIFFYTASDDYTWNKQTKPYDREYVEKFYRSIDPATGNRFMLDNLTGAGTRNGETGQPWRGVDVTAKNRHWIRPPSELDKWDAQGLIYFPPKGGTPRFKRFLDEKKGNSIDNIWTDIPAIGAHSDERLGYPTQKPLSLLQRIIKASSNPNDIVLDAFCGCGTALVAAQNLGRQWIGIDISPTACRVMAKRLRDVCSMKESEPLWKAHRTDAFVVRDLPWTIEKLKQLPPFEFENWAVIALGGIPNKVQVGDMGLDGRIFPVGTKPTDKEGLFSDDWFPIQVKQTDKVGRPDIDQFQAVMEREGEGGRQRGFFVAFGYSRDAEQECAAFHRRTGRIIKLLTVQEILDEEHVQKM